MALADLFTRSLPAEASVGFSAYDGSSAGPTDAPVHVEVRSARALAHLVRAPGEIGLARAYVTGALDVRGDLHALLRIASGGSAPTLTLPERLGLLRGMGVRTLLGAGPLPEELRLRGRRRSRQRDAAAIAHHYTISNRFYELVLGESMAYTCAVYPHADATLEEAQHAKFDLVARKLALRPGSRLLDVGCGWGGMVLHAARYYGARALGVTLARDQAEWAQRAIAAAGLEHLAEVRHLDYREVAEEGFDAVSSIGLTEHVGKAALPGYFAFLQRKLRPGGRLLNHCITRPTTTEPTVDPRGFVNRYVFPDGELLGVGTIVSAMQDHGFEVRHAENLREHYALTLAAWCANLRRHWDAAVGEVGERRARIWLLYMAGSQLSFETNHLQLHQVLGVRTEHGRAGMPLRPDWETGRAAQRTWPYTSTRVPTGRRSHRKFMAGMDTRTQPWEAG